jgi:type I restriction enzyme M protein
MFADPKLNHHFYHGLFHAFESDASMLRIGRMNMLLHGVDNPDVQRSPQRTPALSA